MVVVLAGRSLHATLALSPLLLCDGVSIVITDVTEVISEFYQLCYLGDVLLYGEANQVVTCIAQIETALRKINQELNLR